MWGRFGWYREGVDCCVWAFFFFLFQVFRVREKVMNWIWADVDDRRVLKMVAVKVKPVSERESELLWVFLLCMISISGENQLIVGRIN